MGGTGDVRRGNALTAPLQVSRPAKSTTRGVVKGDGHVKKVSVMLDEAAKLQGQEGGYRALLPAHT